MLYDKPFLKNGGHFQETPILGRGNVRYVDDLVLKTRTQRDLPRSGKNKSPKKKRTPAAVRGLCGGVFARGTGPTPGENTVRDAPKKDKNPGIARGGYIRGGKGTPKKPRLTRRGGLTVLRRSAPWPPRADEFYFSPGVTPGGPRQGATSPHKIPPSPTRGERAPFWGLGPRRGPPPPLSKGGPPPRWPNPRKGPFRLPRGANPGPRGPFEKSPSKWGEDGAPKGHPPF